MGLYDIVGMLVPGAVMVGAALMSFSQIGLFNPSHFADSEFIIATFFILASYIMGHVIHGLGGLFLSARKLGYASKRFLQEKDTHYSATFKKKLRELAAQTFGVEADGDAQKIFDLCYTYTQVRGIDAHIQLMNGRHGFFRNIVISAAITAVLMMVPPLGHWVCKSIDANTIALNILLALLSLAIIPVAFNRWRRFGERFADHVYRTFYVDRLLSR